MEDWLRRKRPKPRGKPKRRRHKKKQKGSSSFVWYSTTKVPFGVDPKSILCEFFKQGLCTKGNKCKFSHDPNVGRKVVKKDLYTDSRQEEKENDTMDNWDEEKLRKVILSKHGNPKTTTEKVCKFFIEAVENGKYGWFWVCPNGGNECKYKHSLPPGFVLKTKEQKKLERLAAENEPKITLEEFLELERSKLDKSKFTPITAESFAKWKQEQTSKKESQRKEDEKEVEEYLQVEKLFWRSSLINTILKKITGKLGIYHNSSPTYLTIQIQISKITEMDPRLKNIINKRIIKVKV